MDGSLKFSLLVWAGLWRRPARTILTALSVAAAFVLVGLLQGVNDGFVAAIAKAHREFLMTDARVRGSPPMPMAMMEQIRKVPGVVEVFERDYFIGEYSSPKAMAALATEPRQFFAFRPGLVAEPKGLDRIEQVRNGMLVTPAQLRLCGWKVGDTVILRSHELKPDGSGDWTFEIVGTFDSVENPNTATLGVFNYAYLDGARVAHRGTAERFYVRIADPNRAVATAASIDRLFENSSHETRTRSDQERAEASAKELGDIAFFTHAVLAAVLFMLLTLTANTMRQSIEERTSEFGVLKALGFTGGQCLWLAFAEAAALCVAAAMLGLVLAWIGAPLARDISATIGVSGTVFLKGLGLAVVLAIASVSLPAWRLYRLSVIDSLAVRA